MRIGIKKNKSCRFVRGKNASSKTKIENYRDNNFLTIFSDKFARRYVPPTYFHLHLNLLSFFPIIIAIVLHN